MEEIVFWKEVDVKDADEVIDTYARNGKRLYLKRASIPILDDKEIDIASGGIQPHNAKDEYHYPNGAVMELINKAWKAGYKAMQERLIGGQGL